jgi:hypothetical protein
MMMIHTEFFRSTVVKNHRLCWVKTAASEEVTELGTVDHTVATIPEVEQVEHLTNVCKSKTKYRFKVFPKPRTTCSINERNATRLQNDCALIPLPLPPKIKRTICDEKRLSGVVLEAMDHINNWRM